ncbi:unnamed protein product [Didymodactylos carnosus]|uniref:Uncharacterized protein n=1 Tax=Didymodactylos carnosus TaxID=1234261 RepID=A0A815CNP0_9BILA|nr:unnamed protein product [Didymodactylos carnosus]CAF4087608.1 unnamed protein product [Didymodactylos carnosus]
MLATCTFPRDPRDHCPKPPFPQQEQDSPGLEYKMSPKPDYGDSGIGRAVALAYAREGADVVISYLNEDQDAAEIKQLVEKEGRKCILVSGDISEESQCQKIVNTTVSEFGHIDILVNNAAYQGKNVDQFTKLDHARVEKTFKVNIIAMFDMVRFTLPHMPPGGIIINTASVQAYHPTAEILDYATTKAAIVALRKVLHYKTFIFFTYFFRPVWTALPVSCYPKSRNADFGKNSKMGRPAMPVELSPAYVYLASNDSTYVVGETIGVTGGILLP